MKGYRKIIFALLALVSILVMLDRKSLKSADFALCFGALCGGYFVGAGVESYANKDSA